eukprot:1620613-Prymnesium_polylepis.1
MHGDAPLSATAGQSATFAWGSLTRSEPNALQRYALCRGERTAALHRLPPWRLSRGRPSVKSTRVPVTCRGPRPFVTGRAGRTPVHR